MSVIEYRLARLVCDTRAGPVDGRVAGRYCSSNTGPGPRLYYMYDRSPYNNFITATDSSKRKKCLRWTEGISTYRRGRIGLKLPHYCGNEGFRIREEDERTGLGQA